MTPPVYETDALLHQYVLFHYGSAEDQLPYPFGPREALFYPVRCVNEHARFFEGARRALDLGCAVGRSTFELARTCPEVIGIDLSQRFIQAAQSIQKSGTAEVARVEEGMLVSRAQRALPIDIDRQRCRFLVGDATKFDPGLGTFDVVLAANLIDRVRSPRQLLQNLINCLSPGGVLILSSPYTWLAEFTPPREWLGGISDETGKPQTTLASLQDLLGSTCDLLATRDLPFLLREHARKFQWSVAQATVWRRRASAGR
ncbi:MAG TPA: putative 4-mercaptohistidine N1-methyltransferase [Chthoniobacterales bacterium]